MLSVPSLDFTYVAQEQAPTESLNATHPLQCALRYPTQEGFDCIAAGIDEEQTASSLVGAH